MIVKVIIVLPCFLSAVMEVCSQTVPYISFKGTNLPNNSYIRFTEVGYVMDGSNSVQCHTDLITCCSGSEGFDRGDWYFPNKTRLPLPGRSHQIYEAREAQRVDLRRRENFSPSEGIYRCDIETSAADNDNRETVYAGLYHSTNRGDVSISGSVQFFVNYDLNEERSKFALTCISTGGPATTVTWTRDSEAVTGGVTVLHNATTAQYNHTLTVMGRLPGQYKCAVSNNKPSSDTASLTVQAASAPTNLMAVQKGPIGIQVSWTPPIPLGDTTGYRIYYRGGSSGSVDVSGGSTDKHLLPHLKNGAAYIISIVGTSTHLISDSADYPNSIPLIPGMPIAEVSSTTATTISFSWSVPNSTVVSYVVTWERDTSGECPVEDRGNKTLTDDSFNYNLKDLEEDSNYTITLTAINAAGHAVSDPVTTLTREAVPSAAPTSVHISNDTFSSITVQWGAVDCIHQNGKITGYSVRYRAETRNTHTVNVSGGAAMAFTLTGLAYSTAYSIDVAAINNAGIGKYSDSITVETKGGDVCPQTNCGAPLGGGVVGGFVGGVLLTATLGAIIFAVVLQRMKTKMNAVTSSGVAKESKGCISTSTNLAYGQVEGVKAAECEMCGMPSVAAMATQEPSYETVST